MIVQLIIAVLFGTLGSYLSFFAPNFLSKNITELSSARKKWTASFISVIAITLLLFQSDPNSRFEWLGFGFVSVFFFIAIIDLYTKIIPNRLVLLLLILTVTQLILHFDIERIVAFGLVTAVLITLNFLANNYFNKLFFGWGDVKLIGVLSLSLGWEVLWVIYIAIIFGGLLSTIGVFTKKISRDSRVPFAMFLLLALLFIESDLLQSILQLIS